MLTNERSLNPPLGLDARPSKASGDTYLGLAAGD